MNIQEVYKKRINNLINEEYGISNTLHYEIIPRFLKQLKSNIKHGDIVNKENYSTKTGNFIFNCEDKNNTEFKVYWGAYYFRTMEECESFIKRYGYPSNYVVYDSKMLKITIFYVDGKPLNGCFYDSIGHEFEHMYQNVLMGKQFGGQSIYNIARTFIQAANTYDKWLACIVYASTKSEQEGFINGFYSEFTNGNIDPSDIDKEIEKSDCGIWLKNLYLAYNFVKTHNDEYMQEAIRKYRNVKDYYTYKHFLYIARNGIKNLERRIARMTCKIKKDLYMHTKPQLNENFDLLNNYFLIQ